MIFKIFFTDNRLHVEINSTISNLETTLNEKICYFKTKEGRIIFIPREQIKYVIEVNNPSN